MQLGRQALVFIAVSTASVQGSAQSVDLPAELRKGLLPAQVIELLGEPDARTETSWTWGAADGEVLELFDRGGVYWPFPPAKLVTPYEPSDRSAVLRATDKALSQEDFDSALSGVSACLHSWPDDRGCRQRLTRLVPLASGDDLAAGAPYRALLAAHSRLAGILTVAPNLSAARAALGLAERQIHAYVVPIYSARLAAHRQTLTAAAVMTSRALVTAGQFLKAASALEGFDSPEVSGARADIQAAATEHWRAVVDKLLPNADATSSAATLEQITKLADVIGEATFSELARRLITDALARVLRDLRLAPDSRSGELYLARHLVAAHPSWRSLIPSVAKAMTFRLEPVVGCDDLGEDELSAAVVQLAAPRLSLSSTETPALTFSIECERHLTSGDRHRVPSSFVARYDQHANPDYLRAQNELSAAETNLNRARIQSANAVGVAAAVVAAAAEGIAAAAVGSAMNRLQATEPFVRVPVRAPYEFEEWSVESLAVVTLRVQSSVAGLAAGTDILLSHRNEGVSNAGVQASDLNGHTPREFQPPAALFDYRAALQAPNDRGKQELWTYVAAVLVSSAEAQVSEGRHLAALGDFVAAQNLNEAALPQRRVSEVRAATGSAVESLHTFRFGVQPVEPTPSTVAVGASGSGAGRTAVIASALRSVVTVSAGASTGSGFFLSADGLLLTNAHVVEDRQARIRIGVHNGDSYLATVLSSNSELDLALLKVQGNGFEPLRLAMKGVAQVGLDVLALGSPLGLTGTVTRGIISAIRTSGASRLIQMDAAINPGNSGGPVILEDGQVVGISTWKVRATSAEAIGFAVSAETIEGFAAAFMRR